MVSALTLLTMIGLAAPAGAVPELPASEAAGAVRPEHAATTGDAASGPPADTPAARAKASGKRVEVVERRSETATVFANPDGTFTAELSALPKRVRRGTGWVPVDTTLQVVDGRVIPRAATVPISFSGGGREPLVRIGQAGRRVELRWPGVLPVPSLAGDTATYREVLPGVDLTLRAGRQGYSKVLVVKSREAARQPALKALRFGLSTTGVRVRNDKGMLVAENADGQVAFRSGRPQLWDAPAQRRTTGERATGVHRATGQVKLGGGHVTVIPDQRFLTDPATVFPVSIDPDFWAGRAAWAKVFSGYPNDSYWFGGIDDQHAKVGRCTYSNCNGIGIARSYFQFDINPLRGKHVLSAEFNAYENYAPSCGPRVVQLYEAGAFGPGLTWNSQPWAYLVGGRNEAHGYNSTCPGAWLGWNVTAQVINHVNGGSATSSYMLRAENEGDGLAWKKFNNDPTLLVTYNSIPDAPSGMSADNRACAVQPNEPYGHQAAPVLRARVSDPDGGLVAAQFEWFVRFGGYVGGATTPMQSTGSEFAAGIPAGAFGDGAKIAYRVRGWDGTDAGPWGDWCDYTVDRTAPDKPPTVTSTLYPEKGYGGGIGRTGSFTLSANGVADVAGFRYGLNTGDPQQYVAADQPGGTASAAVTPTDDGPQDLYVRSVDRAGNLGPIYRSYADHGGYHFLVGGGSPPVAHWPLDGHGAAKNAPELTGNGHHGAVSSSGAGWTAGRDGDAVNLDGVTGGVTTSGGQAVRTDGTFTVTAWAKLSSSPGGAWKIVVSQEGDRDSGFYLQYRGDKRGWSFRLPTADVDNSPADTADASVPAEIGVWTHLAGVYDVGTSQLRLYVNGVLAGSASHTQRWNASGAVRIGTGHWSGGVVDHFPGAIDDVKVYDRLLAATEIRDLANHPIREEAFLTFDETDGTQAVDASGNHRVGTLATGTTRVTGKLGAHAVNLDGTSGEVRTSRPAVRTDGSFTVSAYVKPDALDVTRTAVSQDGERGSGFQLGYRAETGMWGFLLTDGDTDNARGTRVDAPVEPQTDEWTQLTGVYDAAAQKILIYVNGRLEGEAPYVAKRWSASGPLVIGRAKVNGVPVDRWKGAIDNVHAYTGAMTSDQIREEFQTPAKVRYGFKAGVLGQYVGQDGERLTTPYGMAPAGYTFETSLGVPLQVETPGSRMLYSCLLFGKDQFASIYADCEGKERLGILGGR